MNLKAAVANLPKPRFNGYVCVFVFAVSSFMGLMTQSQLLLVFGCLFLGVFIAGFAVAYCNLLGLEVKRQIPFPIFAGATFYSTVTVTNHKYLLSSCLLWLNDHPQGAGILERHFSNQVLEVPAKGYNSVKKIIKFIRHGVVDFDRLTISSTFPLGLFNAKRQFLLPDRVIVFPRLRPIPASLLPDEVPAINQTGIVQAAMTGEEEFAGLREYREGDSPRRIHWKSSARGIGRLLVKEYESVATRHVSLVLVAEVLVLDARNVIRFERAVSLAASFLYELLAHQYVVDFQLIGGGKPQLQTISNDPDLLEVFNRLALLEPKLQERDVEDGYRYISPVRPRLVIQADRVGERKEFEQIIRWN